LDAWSLHSGDRLPLSSLPSLRVLPLGGLGEIGMNCLALEIGGEVLVIDCGVTFPQTDLGIDIFHPDFTWLDHHRDQIKGLVITHGHEDHIGAVPYFAKRFDVPIWGPRHALELIRNRLGEHGFAPNQVNLNISQPRQKFRVGNLELEPIRVAHSIAEATGLVVRSPVGTIVHTGDFKLDPAPSDGELTDEDHFAAVGREGVRLLFSDSTNIDLQGSSGSEALVARTLLPLVEDFEGRVIVGMFASNVQRLRTLGELAMATRRKLLLMGRSVHTHVRIAREIGKLSWPSNLLIAPEQAANYPRREILAIASGTQAERMAALTRMSLGTHPQFALDPGDRVIFSSRVIPGNEPDVMQLMGDFLRQGMDVRSSRTDPGVHVSGHAYRDEQARMIDLVQPEAFIPVHGTLHHLHRHGAMAREKGVREVIVIENGEVAEITPEHLQKTEERTPFAKIPTWHGETIPSQVLKDRELLGRNGIAFVTVLVDGRGKPVGPATIATRGVVDELLHAGLLRQAASEVVRVLSERYWGRDLPTDEDLATVARITARRKIEHTVRRKPLVMATIVRVKT
jgi:ribonuclease J